MIQYILECIAFQLVFLIIYDFFLKRETFFQWNRVYLIGTYVLSMVLPWIKIEALKNVVPEQYIIYPEYLWEANDTVLTAAGQTSSGLSLEYALLFGGMLLAALLFVYKMMQLYQLRKRGEIHFFDDFTKIIIANSSSAFSFFKSIFMGAKILESEQQNIIRHELVHIRQRHSYDLLFFELMRIVGWFNPLVYVYQGRISELHEFIADAQVAKTDKKEHYQLLLSKVFQTRKISFINQFFKSSLIKKRIVMLQKARSKRIFQLKYLFLVPVISAMLLYAACQNELSADDNNTIIVADIENLTQEEEKKVFDKLMNLSENSKDWELYVKDGNASMRFVSSTDGSYLSGPNGKKIKAKLAIDSKFTSKKGNSIYEELLKNRTKKNGSSPENTFKKYNELLVERNRLLKSTDEDNPIIRNLDEQMNFLKQQVLDENPGTIPFSWVDQVPVFPGCELAENKRECFQKRIQEHIRKHFNYPKDAEEQGIQGRVNIMFTMDEEGNITDIRKRGPHKLLEDEAVRIISKLPQMTPGKYDGKTVKTPFSIPITFKLQ